VTAAARTGAPRVLFLCRGSTRDGLGHVMRSRTVAESMRGLASVQMVVIGDRYVSALLHGRTVPHVVVEDESAALAEYTAMSPDVVVFDMLRFGRDPFRWIAQSCPTVSLSPVFDRLHEVDHFFHRTVEVGDDFDAASFGGVVHAGLEYAVIRPECRAIEESAYRRHLDDRALAVAISMGGADAGNKTLRVLQRMRRITRPILFWILLGEGYGHSYEALTACVAESPRHEMILAKTSDSMWRILGGCTLAVLAGGTVSYEAARAGLPAINLFESGDQEYLCRELVDRGVAWSAGYPLPAAIDRAADLVARFDLRRDDLLAAHRRCRRLIDGRGADRIAAAIAGLASAPAAERQEAGAWRSA